MSTISGIAKENEIKDRLGLSGAAAAPPSTDTTSPDPLTEPTTPSRHTEPLHLEGENEPINLRLDLSRAAKPQR